MVRYAHFDGDWIARQLEIHPNGALLLIAGKDDMDMCELSLNETKLLERPGAEITCEEFDDTWVSYGGKLNQVFSAVSKGPIDYIWVLLRRIFNIMKGKLHFL